MGKETTKAAETQAAPAQGANPEANQTAAVATVNNNDYGKIVLDLVKERQAEGMTLPKDYNFINAVKCSMIALSDLRDKNGRHFAEVCTPTSIKCALFKMVTKGLDVSKGQGYMTVRGNKLCFDDEYFGKICQIRRIYPNWQPVPHVVYEGDTFEYGIDAETGYTKLIKHEQKLENRNVNKWVGGYIYFPTADGKRDLYVMSKYEIEAAWSQSPNQNLTVHKKFLEKMVGKTLINTGSTRILNPTDSTAPGAGDTPEPQEPVVEDAEAVEVIDVSESAEKAAEVAESVDAGAVPESEQGADGKLFEL